MQFSPLLLDDRNRQYEKRAKRRAIRQLHDAVGKNQLDTVREMLTPDLDVNFHYNGESALQIAVVKGLEEMCKILIAHGADVDKYNAEDNTLLHMAAWNGHAQIVELLVKHEAELDNTNNHGATPLNSAAYRGHAEVNHISKKMINMTWFNKGRCGRPLQCHLVYYDF